MSARLSCCFDSFHTFYYSANRLRGYFYNRNFEGNEKLSHIHLPHLSAPASSWWCQPSMRKHFSYISKSSFLWKDCRWSGFGLHTSHQSVRHRVVSQNEKKNQCRTSRPAIQSFDTLQNGWACVSFHEENKSRIHSDNFPIVGCVFGAFIYLKVH